MLDGSAEPGRAVGASAEGGGLGSMVWLWAGAAPSTGVSPAGGAALEAAGRLPGASEVPFICRHANKLPHLQKRKHAIPQTCIQLNSRTIRKINMLCVFHGKESSQGQEREAGGSAPGTACSARASWAHACASQRPHGL